MGDHARVNSEIKTQSQPQKKVAYDISSRIPLPFLSN